MAADQSGSHDFIFQSQIGPPAKIPVLLLKTKSTPADGYEEYFRTVHDAQYNPVFVPVLEHKFNTSAVENVTSWIASGAFSAAGNEHSKVSMSYGGVIFTSQRAVEAFAQAVETVKASHEDIESLLPNTLPLYVVGPATALSVQAIGLKCKVVGDHTGNGEALAGFILEHYNQLNANSFPKRPLLFLVGEQRRDIIPKTLQDDARAESERIKVDELTVYETGVMAGFAEAFRDAATPAARAGLPQWAVVFSPTGCKAMLDVIDALEKGQETRSTFIATIGPTTRDHLRNQMSIEPHATAAKPNPQALGEAMLAYMKRIEGQADT